MRNFWEQLRKKGTPIVGLSPMDGVTDAPMRKCIAETTKPDVIITEFVNVEGLARGAVKMLEDFVYDECERPVVAQIYGTEVDSFYKVAFVVCELGFDGVDINMGCPAKKVAHRGAGAGLIDTPCHANEIIQSVQKAVHDFAGGMTMEEAGVRPKVINKVREMREKMITENQLENTDSLLVNKNTIPVSVKTRMGTVEIVAEKWIESLLSQDIQAITLHGRTLKQGYSGDANWEVIKKVGKIVSDYNQKPENSGKQVVFLGNGDIESFEDAQQKISDAEISGALIGRATFGNPWIFSENTELQFENIPEKTRKMKCLEHCVLFEEIFPNRPFFIMRKHIGWYMKHFSGSRELRRQLMLANSSEEVKQILEL